MQRNAEICGKMVLSMKVFSDFLFDHRKYHFWYPENAKNVIFLHFESSSGQMVSEKMK